MTDTGETQTIKNDITIANPTTTKIHTNESPQLALFGRLAPANQQWKFAFLALSFSLLHIIQSTIKTKRVREKESKRRS